MENLICTYEKAFDYKKGALSNPNLWYFGMFIVVYFDSELTLRQWRNKQAQSFDRQFPLV